MIVSRDLCSVCDGDPFGAVGREWCHECDGTGFAPLRDTFPARDHRTAVCGDWYVVWSGGEFLLRGPSPASADVITYMGGTMAACLHELSFRMPGVEVVA